MVERLLVDEKMEGDMVCMGGITYPPIMVQFAKAALGPPVYMAKLNKTGMPGYLRVSKTFSVFPGLLMDIRHTRDKVHGDICGGPVLKESQMAEEFCRMLQVSMLSIFTLTFQEVKCMCTYLACIPNSQDAVHPWRGPPSQAPTRHRLY